MRNSSRSFPPTLAVFVVDNDDDDDAVVAVVAFAFVVAEAAAPPPCQSRFASAVAAAVPVSKSVSVIAIRPSPRRVSRSSGVSCSSRTKRKSVFFHPLIRSALLSNVLSPSLSWVREVEVEVYQKRKKLPEW